MSNFEKINMKEMQNNNIEFVDQTEGYIRPEDIKHEHDHGHDDAALFDAAWEKSSHNYLIDGLKAGKNIEDLLNDMPGFKEAFSQESLLDNPNCCFQCSDERCQTEGLSPSNKGVKVALAGEGLLLGPEDRAILVEALRGKNIKITGHEGCGAAKIAHPESQNSDTFGYSGAEELARETGNTYEKATKETFRSPIHDGRALVVDGTLRFNSAYLDAMPAHFRTDSAGLGLSDEYIGVEIKALTNIAVSTEPNSHGLGKRFTEENPFYVIISAKDQEQLNHLMEIGKEAIKDFDGRAAIKGFIAPQE